MDEILENCSRSKNLLNTKWDKGWLFLSYGIYLIAKLLLTQVPHPQTHMKIGLEEMWHLPFALF